MRGKDFIKKWSDEQARKLAETQDIFILAGCAFCGRRLIKDGEVIEDTRVVYQQGPYGRVPIGDACCSFCFEELFCDHNSD